MKYLSVLFFALAFGWTWTAITSIPPVGIQTHSGIQANMADLIATTLKNKKPTAKDLVIQRMKTQEGENGEVLVFFQYKFNEYDADNNPVGSQIAGVATLNRSEKQHEDGKEHWVLKKVTTTNDVISFEEGLRIVAGPASASNETPSDEPTPTPTPAHQ